MKRLQHTCQGRFRSSTACCSHNVCVQMDYFYAFVDVCCRSPSVTTMRDIDPKLPAARPNLEGYPLSDGDWPADDRYIYT